ncbi:MAG: hypothetical protein IT314_06050 [Anaerolineales bacterium]|nr:hypothetical protein [Anaerolineales bacterium]
MKQILLTAFGFVVFASACSGAASPTLPVSAETVPAAQTPPSIATPAIKQSDLTFIEFFSIT